MKVKLSKTLNSIFFAYGISIAIMKLVVQMTFLSLLTSVAFASTKNNLIMTSSTPFETLQQAFISAGPAQLSDFPLAGDLYTPRSRYRCVSVCRGVCSVEDKLHPITIGRLDIIIAGRPALPGDGPLFPGHPAIPDGHVIVMSPILTTNGNPSTNDELIKNLEANQDNFLTQVIGGELVSTATVGGHVVKTAYRKRGQELYFSENGNEMNQSFGYCFLDSLE